MFGIMFYYLLKVSLLAQFCSASVISLIVLSVIMLSMLILFALNFTEYIIFCNSFS